MTPDQFLARIQTQQPAPAYLFVGSEPYRLGQCRRALIERVLPEGEREDGLSRHDLAGVPLSAVIDDARSLSLFVSRRVIWVSNAEAALPRGRAGAEVEREVGAGAAAALAAYLRNPSPGVVVVIEASRYDLEGEDKLKAERVRKFFSAVPAVVEFTRFSVQEARRLAQELARKAGLQIGAAEIDLLVETLGADALRIAAEIEKLELFAGPAGRVRAEDLAALTPDSSVSTVFVLVDALGRGDRLRALELLHTLLRQGEYMPLVLSFLSGLFRLALVAREMGLANAQQIQDRLSRPGRPVWRSRAEQIHQTSVLFSKRQLEDVLKKIHAADKALRDARPDDRIVVEEFILRLAE